MNLSQIGLTIQYIVNRIIKSHLNIELEEPDYIVGEGDSEDDDYKEPSMAFGGGLEKSMVSLVKSKKK